MKYLFDIPQAKKVRVIINTDAKNEADDQFAIVQAILSPKLIIKNITAAHYRANQVPDSVQRSYDEIIRVLSLMGTEGEIPVSKGATHPMADECTPIQSEGADVIIEEAMKDDTSPLFVLFLGQITDLASAYLKQPQISGRLTAIWIGGGAYPIGGNEFNLSGDVNAANVVFSSNIDLWQVPKDIYSSVRVSISELAVKVMPYGKIGEYLYTQLVEFNLSMQNNAAWPKGESWSLGDSPAIALLLDAHDFSYTMVPAPRFNPDFTYVPCPNNRPIRVYNHIDPRFILEDLYAKLSLYYSKN